MRTQIVFPKIGLWLPIIICLAGRSADGADLCKFERLTPRHGLSHSVVYSVLQDHQGYMWFAGEGGLNRYDGHAFRAFNPNPHDTTALATKDISQIFQTRDGRIWLSTWGAGLNVLDPATLKFVRLQANPQSPHGLQDNRVQMVYQDKAGTLWIGTYQSGLQRLHFNEKQPLIPDRLQFDRFSTDTPVRLSNNRVWVVAEGYNDDIWIGTDDGLNLLNPLSDEIRYLTHNYADSTSLSHSRVRAILKDHTGVYWIGTQSGLNRYDPQRNAFTRYFPHPEKLNSVENIITSLWEDHTGQMWVGTEGGGLARLDRQTGQFQIYTHDRLNPNSLSHDDVRALCEDASGNLWIATRGGGVNKLDLKPQKFQALPGEYTAAFQLSHNTVTAVWMDRFQRLWLGTDGGGVNLVTESESGEIKNVTTLTYEPESRVSLALARIRAIYEDSYGDVWIGMYQNGLIRVPATEFATPKTPSVFQLFAANPDDSTCLSNGRIMSIVEDKARHLWIGTDHGLNRLDLSRLQQSGQIAFTRYFQENGLPDNSISALLCDSGGQIWIGTRNGLAKWQPGSSSFKQYQHQDAAANSLSDNLIQCLTEDAAGQIWVGTAYGLNQLNPTTGQIQRFFMTDGLANDVINSLTTDINGHVWIATNQGLTRYNPAAKSFRSYGMDHGLPAHEFYRNAIYKSPTGRIVLGSFNGAAAFDPGKLQDNSYEPPVVLTAFKKFDHEIEFDRAIGELDVIQLSYRDNFFSIEFAALDYTHPERNQYAYKLEGFDTGWINAGNRCYASYTNLDGGRYTFSVRAANSDGIWSSKNTSVRLIIAPPFWKTWWFRSLIAGLLIGIVIAGFALQRRRYQLQIEQKGKLEEMERARSIQLSLIPKHPPSDPDFIIAGYMKTAREVGGDYYDFIRSGNDGKLYITIGDVAGKGIPASLLMVEVRAIFHSLAPENLPTLDIIVRANRLLYPHLAEMVNPMFITMLLLGWDHHTGELTYTGAGHERILVYRRATKKCEVIRPGGVCLGIVDSIEYAVNENTLQLNAGDRIMLYTDGVTEYQNSAKEMFGLPKLTDFFAKTGENNPKDIITQLLETLREFSQGEVQMDDVTVVVMEKK